eukprot:8360399-Lingulodinium_polyedra.AAC.1
MACVHNMVTPYHAQQTVFAHDAPGARPADSEKVNPNRKWDVQDRQAQQQQTHIQNWQTGGAGP